VLYVLREARSLVTAMKSAVAMGGDTDTTAAIVGGILGCQLQDVTADILWLPRVVLPESAVTEATVTGCMTSGDHFVRKCCVRRSALNSARMVGQLRRLSDHAAAVVVASW
jgi:ADP-ribosylglycohydrolase